MRKLHWMIARITDRISLVAGLAWLLLIGIALQGIYTFLPAQQQLKALEQQVLKIRPSEQIIYTYVSPSDQFFEKIPHINSVTSSIQTLFDVANNQHIAINEIIYKDEQKTGEKVVRYTMNFSVVASYPMIKAFIVDALAALPYLALEQLSFEREDKGSNIVSAHLRFTLYLVR